MAYSIGQSVEPAAVLREDEINQAALTTPVPCIALFVDVYFGGSGHADYSPIILLQIYSTCQ